MLYKVLSGFTRLHQGCIRFYLVFVGVSSGPYTALSVYKGFAEFILRAIRAWQGFIKLYRASRGFSCKGFVGVRTVQDIIRVLWT